MCKNCNIFHHIQDDFFLSSSSVFIFFVLENTQGQTAVNKQPKPSSDGYVDLLFFAQSHIRSVRFLEPCWRDFFSHFQRCLENFIKRPCQQNRPLQIKYVMLTIRHSTIPTNKHAQMHFVSTISIHIGMVLVCPAIPLYIPSSQKNCGIFCQLEALVII